MKILSRTLFALSIFVTLLSSAHADVHPSALFSDNVVLQRDVEIPVWGTANPGEPVTVTLSGKTASAVADQSGNWKVDLPPMQAGGPYTLTIAGQNTVTIANVLIGDVWVCSGQSNMTFEIAWFDKSYYTADIAGATDTGIREFNDDDGGSLTPQTNVSGSWTVCSPDTVVHFATVAYFFARTLRRAMPDVPIGIVHSSVGGTPAEPWTPIEFLNKDSALASDASSQIASLVALPNDKQQFPIDLASWTNINGARDTGNTGFTQGWADPKTDVSSWQTVTIPTNLNALSFKGGGVVWFRKTLTFAPNAADSDFDLGVNWNDSVFDVYVNGVQLAPNGAPEAFYGSPQSFHVPKALIKAGQPNTIAIRMYSLTNDGYLWLTTKDMSLPVSDPSTEDNNWSFKAEQTFPALTDAAKAAEPKAPSASMNQTPTTLYNGKIAPLTPYAIKGVLWYQGESNAGRADRYATLLPLLISGWRAHWNEGNFPFYIVQLANYGTVPAQPGNSGWATIRDAQLKTSQTVPNSGIVVTIDTAKRDEIIHPLDKQDVGYRTGLVALARTYGKKIEYYGPMYSSFDIENGSIRVHFTHAGGLVSKGGALQWFQIAGADQKWVWANAVIDGSTVVVSSPTVATPVAVRYAWADNPFGCNLYNADGLPASPFRTDAWQ